MLYRLFENKYFEAEGGSDTGILREENQDAILVSAENGCFAVADGVGGGEAGDQAAQMLVDILMDYSSSRHILPTGIGKAVYKINEEIVGFANKYGLKGMGTTVVGMNLNGFQPGEACVFHAGDSRAYRFRKGKLTLMTRDHTLGEAMGRRAVASETEEALLNAVGIGDNFYLEMNLVEIEAKDLYLLCSDGLHKQVTEKSMLSVLKAEISLKDKVDQLIDLANDAGGIDNVSIVLILFGTLPEMTADILEEKAEVADNYMVGDDVTPPTR